MAQWKKLIQVGKDTESNYSGSKPQKYTPKKSFRQDNSPLRFHNQTIDKINNSVLSQQKEKQKSLRRSFVGRSNQQEMQRGLKTSASQMKLNTDLRKNYPPQNIGSQVNPPVDNQRLKQRISGDVMNLKVQKSLLFQQIQKLKKEFKAFQSLILRQLNRQQKNINSMVEQLLNKIRERGAKTERSQNFYDHEIQTPLTPQEKHEPFRTFLNKKSINSEIEDSQPDHKKVLEGQKQIFNIQNQFEGFADRQKSAPIFSFDRLFMAVDNLKKQLKQLNDINEKTFLSPINQAKNLNWQQQRAS